MNIEDEDVDKAAEADDVKFKLAAKGYNKAAITVKVVQEALRLSSIGGFTKRADLPQIRMETLKRRIFGRRTEIGNYDLNQMIYKSEIVRVIRPSYKGKRLHPSIQTIHDLDLSKRSTRLLPFDDSHPRLAILAEDAQNSFTRSRFFESLPFKKITNAERLRNRQEVGCDIQPLLFQYDEGIERGPTTSAEQEIEFGFETSEESSENQEDDWLWITDSSSAEEQEVADGSL
jgi:hypothetical protein